MQWNEEVTKTRSQIITLHVWIYFFIADKLILLEDPSSPLMQSWPILIQHQPKYNVGPVPFTLNTLDLIVLGVFRTLFF